MQDNDQQGRGGKKGKKPGKSQSQVESLQQLDQQGQHTPQRQQQKDDLEALAPVASASSSVSSPPDKEAQEKESSDPGAQAVMKRWRKYSKKAESIRQLHEKQGEGVQLNGDQKVLLTQETEILIILDELNQIKAELAGDSPKEQLNKRIRKFRKKAQTIEGIKQKQSEGAQINEDQKKCLAGEAELQAVLTELTSLQSQLEKECPQVFGAEADGNNS